MEMEAKNFIEDIINDELSSVVVNEVHFFKETPVPTPPPVPKEEPKELAVQGTATTSCDGWTVTQQNGETIFTKFGSGEVLELTFEP